MNIALYNEIANTRFFEMEQKAFHAHAKMFLTHYRELTAEEKQKSPAPGFILTASTGFAQKVYLGDGSRIARSNDLDETDVIINCIRFEGPIMRNGGGCAYGSKEIRDQIIEAANQPQCIGHIFIVDTPGGSSYAKYDFKEALDYAHAKKQKSVLYVDGMLMSAGMAWGACCQKIIAHAPYCQLGCMGTFGAFYTSKDQDVNTVTQEMFHEVYATTSPDKNRMFRQAAQGDNTDVQEYVDRENEKYIKIIRKGRPNVTDEQLLGGDYEAAQVIGTLCDGIQTFDEVVNDMLDAAGVTRGNSPEDRKARQTGLLFATEATRNMQRYAETKKEEDDPQPEDPKKKKKDDDDDDDPNQPVPADEPDDDDPDEKKQTKQSHNNTMKEYQNIRTALGLESFEHDSKNGIYLVEEYADTIENKLQQLAQAQETIEAKHNEIKQLNETIRQLREQATANDAESARKEEESKTEREKERKDLEEQIRRLNETIQEKDRMIAEISEQPLARQQPATVTQTVEEQAVPVLASDKGSVQAQRKAYAERMKYLNEHRSN